MAEIVLLDTGPLVALADRGEEFHAWAAAQLHRLHEPMVTCGVRDGELIIAARAGGAGAGGAGGRVLRHGPCP